MRLKIFRFKRGGSVLVLALFLIGLVSGPALGAGANLRCDGTQGSGLVYVDTIGGTPVPTGRVLQYISGAKRPPDPNNGCLSGGNISLYLGQVGDGTGSPDGGDAGTFYVQDTSANGTPIYVRVWNTASLPTSGNSSNRYGYSQLFTAAGGSSPPLNYPVLSFVTNYIANAPAKPTITSITGLGYDGATINWSLNNSYEITREVFSWGTDIDASNGDSFVVSGTSYTFPRMELDPNTTYHVKVKANNYFGDGTWSDADSFTTKGTSFGGTAIGLRIQYGGSTVTLTWEGSATTFEVWSADLDGDFAVVDSDATSPWNEGAYTTVTGTSERYFQVRVPNGQSALETVGWFTFDMAKGATTGINSVSFPFDMTVPGNSPRIFDASDVEASIGVVNFEFIGGWDEVSQTEFAYLSGGSGTDFTIERGQGYQISVANPTLWTVVGER